MIWAGVAIIAIAILCAKVGPPERTVTTTHRGLEMKARNGRLVYVRQTESEREV